MDPLLVVMGVSGAGKSTVGAALAKALGVPFAEGDGFHAPESVAKMRRGEPLDDLDRRPWLDAVGAWLAARDGGGVVSCSALRRCYRDTLRAWAPRTLFLQLNAPASTLERRIDARGLHFMPSSLLGSQLATLEPLAADEAGCALDSDGVTPDELAARCVRWLRAH